MAIPVIGLTTYQGLNDQGLPISALLRAYQEAILQAGAAPLLVPAFLPEKALESILSHLDGLLLTGGGDIASERFDGQAHSRIYGVDPERDSLEFSLLNLAMAARKPFLGICRGIQVINVHFGGSLYTHIEDQKPDAIKHDYFPGWRRDHRAHLVRVEQGTHLAEIVGSNELLVNSLHHQGIKGVATRLRAVAFSPDGLVEGLELPDYPYGLAVQWHPEWLTDEDHARRLFRSFVEACR
jgi:putative glutamine amidotransferase